MHHSTETYKLRFSLQEAKVVMFTTNTTTSWMACKKYILDQNLASKKQWLRHQITHLYLFNLITFCEVALRGITLVRCLVSITSTVKKCESVSFSRIEHCISNHVECLCLQLNYLIMQKTKSPVRVHADSSEWRCALYFHFAMRKPTWYLRDPRPTHMRKRKKNGMAIRPELRVC